MANIAVTSSPSTQASPPLEPEGIPSTILKIQHGIAATRDYATLAVEDVIKPSLKTFIETCDTNPWVAAIVATPALLAFFVVVAFFILSASALVLYSTLTISVGIIFVVVGGLVSLAVKLLIVLLATIPMAGMATGLLVAANSASQFIINKLPKGNAANVNMSKTLKEMDWKAIIDGTLAARKYIAHAAKETAPVLISIRDALYILARATQLAFETAKNALSDYQGAAASENEFSAGESEERATESGPEDGNLVKESDEAQNEEIVPILIDNHERQSQPLKRRTPFLYNVAESEEPRD